MMPKLDPGTYRIYNRVLSPLGEQLAITFDSKGLTAIVMPYGPDKTQEWIIKDFGDEIVQTISPKLNPGLQAAWGDDGVKFLPAGTHVWTVRKGNRGCTIKNGDTTVSWGIPGASSTANVTIGLDTGSEKQRWIFDRVW